MANELVFRRAEPRDVPEIRSLTRAAYAPWVDVIGREPLPMIADYDAAIQNHIIELAVEAGEVRGLIEMVGKTDSLLIENIAVSPSYQGRGLGSALLRHAEKWADTLGLPTLRLYTNQKFQSNIAFYERFGFGVESTEPFKEGWTVYMRKSLEKDN